MKQKLLSTFISLVCVVCLTFTLTACNENNSGKDNDVETNENNENNEDEQKTPSEGLRFSLSKDGESYNVYGIGTCTDADIVIPDVYDGLPVTSIGDAFYWCTEIKSVIIPDSVLSIGNYAFFHCETLENITIGSSVTFIGAYAFGYCSSLNKVTFKNTSGWYITGDNTSKSGTDIVVTDSSKNAAYFKTDYYNMYWCKN